MINLLVGEHECSIPEKWNEINLKDYTKIFEIINQNKFVEPADDIQANFTESERKTLELERGLHNVRINRKVFAEFTGIDKSIINQVDGDEMANTLSLMAKFLNGEVEKKALQKEQNNSFELKGKKYFYPIAEMKDTSFGDYIEAAQLELLAEKHKAGRVGIIAEQMAVLCRENGEQYDEKLVAKKTKLFGALTMDVVWSFVFFLTKQTNIFKKHIQTYSRTEGETAIDTQQSISKS